MINKLDFNAKNLTSNAGIFLLFEEAKNNGIFEMIENDLIFDNQSTNKIKMNHIKTMLCGHFKGSKIWYERRASSVKIILGKWRSISNDDAFVQLVFAI